MISKPKQSHSKPKPELHFIIVKEEGKGMRIVPLPTNFIHCMWGG
ncbi:MAG: hypothetical protein ABH950_04430 [Candidatus Altiarchaeota archaeon]